MSLNEEALCAAILRCDAKTVRRILSETSCNPRKVIKDSQRTQKQKAFMLLNIKNLLNKE